MSAMGILAPVLEVDISPRIVISGADDCFVGEKLGKVDGCPDGLTVTLDGVDEGSGVGKLVGGEEGSLDGNLLGNLVGIRVGNFDGLSVSSINSHIPEYLGSWNIAFHPPEGIIAASEFLGTGCPIVQFV